MNKLYNFKDELFTVTNCINFLKTWWIVINSDTNILKSCVMIMSILNALDMGMLLSSLNHIFSIKKSWIYQENEVYWLVFWNFDFYFFHVVSWSICPFNSLMTYYTQFWIKCHEILLSLDVITAACMGIT